MAGAVIDSIGLISGGLTIASFFMDNLPGGGSSPVGAHVQIKSGLGDDSISNLKGFTDSVYAYDYNNNYLGQSGYGCGEGADGGSCELTVDQGSFGTVQADYVSVANGDDATCISWISVTQSDGSPGGAWTGDIGDHCGVRTYYGNQQAGTYPDGSTWRPLCAWFDSDGTDGIKYAALKFTVRAYGELSSDTITKNQGCSATLFAPDNGPINGKILLR
ncbi:uncharacterized protein LTR77_009556 [Saxophila tyrrhenica]|uniref:Uncharacterized protein n=1 Tax=Saxophila tyrrhenica TaxID=1690608 RepID=A0AAV9P0T5_9PEZI|nr:hypothetical protein LTR77_009556 [Saxophila tyrrhenica]